MKVGEDMAWCKNGKLSKQSGKGKCGKERFSEVCKGRRVHGKVSLNAEQQSKSKLDVRIHWVKE